MLRVATLASALLCVSFSAEAETWRVFDSEVSYDQDSLRYIDEMDAVVVFIGYPRVEHLIPPNWFLFSCSRAVQWERPRTRGEGWEGPYRNRPTSLGAVRYSEIAAMLCSRRNSYLPYKGGLPDKR